jgi:hypothetical protein
MQHFLDGYPILRLFVLAVLALALTVIAQRGLRYGYVPMQIYHWRRKTDPFTYWCFMIFYCIAAFGLWCMTAATLLRVIG